MTDNSTILKAQRLLMSSAKELEAMADDVADAKQIKEYDSDRRKRNLSAMVAEFLEQGESAAAAEHKARAHNLYKSTMDEQAAQLRAALRVIEKHEATKILWESSRSLLSVEKAKIGLL